MQTFLKDENELEDVIEFVKSLLKEESKIILLKGDLASGKTTFVQKFVKSLGVSDDVTSPTFSIMQNYGEDIFHYDIYNKGVGEFLALGLGENLDTKGYHLIEWADDALERMLREFMFEFVILEIEEIDEIRQYQVKSSSDS